VEALVPLLKEGAARSAEMIARITGENPVANNGAAAATNIATDIDCDECGKPMVIRNGRRGKFLGCSGYPKCKNTSEVPAKLLEELGLNGANGNGQADSNGHAPDDAKPATKKGKSRAPVTDSDDIETDLLVE